MLNRKFFVVSGLVILLAALLRFTNLNSLPVFADEAIYVRWAQVMRAEPTLRFLPLSDGKQPLYMWAVIPMFKLIADPLVAARTFSGLVGLGTVLGVAVAAYILFHSRRVALLAAAIWAVLPYAVFFERMALADGLLTFFVIWGFVFLVLSLNHLAPAIAMLSGYSFGFAWLTKSPAMFALALSPTVLLSVHRHTRKSSLIRAGLLLSTIVIAFAMYNILRLGPEFHMIALRNRDYVFTISEILHHPLDPLIPHLKDVFWFLLYLTTPVGLLLLGLGILDLRTIHLRQRLVLLLWFFVPVFVQSFIAKAFTARYLLFALPFAAILMAHGVEHLGDRTRKHFLILVGIGLFLIAGLYVDLRLVLRPDTAPLPRIERSGYLEEWTAGFGLREVASYIRDRAGNGPVVVGAEGYFGTPFDGLQMYLNHVPNVRVVGLDFPVSAPPAKLTNALEDNQVFMVVNSDRFNNPRPDQAGLRLISAYPKAERPDFTQDALLFFEVVKP